ncbi:MAG: RNA polymerase subunit sigma-70 [Deltaproteobacteria bacterium]|nr:RNA polymerase subunit sigma-70 [Deltaproteobacteria bacterium]
MVTRDDEAWLARFHAGDRSVLEACYREHFAAVDRVVAGMLGVADRETVIHEVFFRVLSSAELRQSFTGGSMSAWLRTLAKNQAIDLLRAQGRNVPLEAALQVEARIDDQPDVDGDLHAKRLVERFQREVLPMAWAGVFEKRFLAQLDQRAAAAALNISRTTLAYRELRIRAMLRRFVLNAEDE